MSRIIQAFRRLPLLLRFLVLLVLLLLALMLVLEFVGPDIDAQADVDAAA